MGLIRDLSIIFVFVIYLFAGCGGDDRQSSQPPAEVEQELSRFSLVQTQGGRTRWKLDADAATFLESERIRISKVELLVFGNKDGQTLTVRGQQGEVDRKTNDIRIMGNVEGASSEGGRFSAQEVYWRENTGKIYTLPGVKVRITYEDSIVIGEELEADPDLETVKLKNIEGITRKEEK